MKKPTYIDIFAGCGGLSLGLHNAGWQGLFAVEKNADAFKTLEYNLIEKVNHFLWPDWLPKTSHDINVVLKDYKEQLLGLQRKVDLVVGGPPCQGFSMAGRRKENDQRNNLVKSYIKFIKTIQPKIIFFENVKGFTLEFRKNKDKGKEYSSYVECALNRAGYYVKGELVNFGEYGIPQKRTRFILVGVRKDVPNVSKDTASQFFSLIKNNRHSFLSKKNLTIETTLGDAISDLLRENGEVDSPDTKSFKAGMYSSIKSSYQQLMRIGVNQCIPDSHRFPKHCPKSQVNFKLF